MDSNLGTTGRFEDRKISNCNFLCSCRKIFLSPPVIAAVESSSSITSRIRLKVLGSFVAINLFLQLQMKGFHRVHQVFDGILPQSLSPTGNSPFALEFHFRRALKPACSKCLSPVRASVMSSRCMTTNEMQSVRDQSLSWRAR